MQHKLRPAEVLYSVIVMTYCMSMLHTRFFVTNQITSKQIWLHIWEWKFQAANIPGSESSRPEHSLLKAKVPSSKRAHSFSRSECSRAILCHSCWLFFYSLWKICFMLFFAGTFLSSCSRLLLLPPHQSSEQKLSSAHHVSRLHH